MHESYCREGYYNLVERSAKVAVVMGTHVPTDPIINRGRSLIKSYENKVDDFVFFTEKKLDLVKFSLACHKHYAPQVDYELIIVDNSSEDPSTLEFLDSYTSEHNITFLSRENTGFSFGSYDFAWKHFGIKYDFYLFHEQDIVPTQDGWLAMILTKLYSERNVGAVGNLVQGYDRHWFMDHAPGLIPHLHNDVNSDDFKHHNLDGMFLFTSSRILGECGLHPIYGSGRGGMGGELVWTEHILSAGYKLLTFHDGTYKVTSDLDYVDFGNTTATRYAPLMHGQTLYCNQEMRDYFSWYDKINDFPPATK